MTGPALCVFCTFRIQNLSFIGTQSFDLCCNRDAVVGLLKTGLSNIVQSEPKLLLL